MRNSFDAMNPYQRAIAKGHLGSCGISYDDMAKPIVGIVNTWNDIVPGHCHFKDLAEEVKRGVRKAGGLPLEFGAIAICDGIAQGHSGMKYSLPSRELIADSVEAMVRGHGIFDGLVMLGSCDKIVPGLLMAAGRLNIPAIIVTGGPMENKIKPWQSKEARQKFLKGQATEKELFEATVDYYPSPGICPFLGTANTVSIMAEVLGMALPGSSLIPAMSSGRRQVAYQSGQAIIDLIEKQLKPRAIMTKDAFHNAITVVAAMGASLNTVLHLPAIAHDCGVKVTYDDFDTISKNTPLIVRVVPNSKEYTVADLSKVGGMPVVLNQLKPLLKLNALTVADKTMGEALVNAPQPDGVIVKPLTDPFENEGGIAILKGNLAPDGAVVKSSAVPKSLWQFSGPAKVFNSEEECLSALEEGRVQEGDVVVVRYEGPCGGPGMREMHRLTEIVSKFAKVAIVTDGRFSGASAGLSVGYLSPEAAADGPLALVQDGDIIALDIDKRVISWEVSEQEQLERRKAFQGYQLPEETSEFLKLYRRSTTSAAAGAIRAVK